MAKQLGALGTLLLGTVLLSGRASAQDPTEVAKQYPPYSPTSGYGSYVLGPNYRDAPELLRSFIVPHGKVVRFTMDSKGSKIYPGIAKNQTGTVPYRRNVTVYVPAQASPTKPLPFIVSQDSMGRGELPTILDNMIGHHRLPAMAAIMIDSGGGDAQGSQRGLEYDTMSGLYADFIESEVIPRVERECGIKLTKDPNARMTMGGSSGGACALSMAWYRPNLYRRVLSYSGTFVNQQWPVNPETPHGAWNYHESLIAATKRKPLRLWLQVGENDLRSHDAEETLHNWPMANERMAVELAKKRYPFQFVYCWGAYHVDGRAVRQTLPQALSFVWADYMKDKE